MFVCLAVRVIGMRVLWLMDVGTERWDRSIDSQQVQVSATLREN